MSQFRLGSTDTTYTLALALRDMGRVDEALATFAQEVDIAVILSQDPRKSGKDYAFYGNVGRCLQLKGRLKDALACYVKSADLLSEKHDANAMLNQGYAAMWIGQGLGLLDQHDHAYCFLRRAMNLWRVRAPLRAREPEMALMELNTPTAWRAPRETTSPDT